jgi:hypothetical protein
MIKFNLQYGSKKENLKLGIFFVDYISCDLISIDSK